MDFTLINIMVGIDFLPVLAVVLIAWFVPVVLSLVKVQRVPAAVVEIMFGYAAGFFFLGQVSGNTLFILDFLALFGLIFIMFLSGLEIDVDLMTGSFPRRFPRPVDFLKNPLLAGILHFLATLGLSYLGTWLLASVVHIENLWFFSLILTTTFLGLVLPVLKNRGEISSRFGQMLIIAAAVADVLSIFLLTITAIILRYGFDTELLLVVSLFLVFFISYKLGKKLRYTLFQKITFQLAHAASQISIRGTMLLLLIFVALSQFLGQEGILLGAFLSGLLLSFFLHKERSLLMLKLDGMGFGFFIPVFFIMVGARFDYTKLLEFDKTLIPFLVILTFLMFAVKLIPSFLWVRLFGWRRTMAGGFLMAARLGLVIAAASIGLELGVVTEGVNSSFVIMAVITCLFSPFLYNAIFKQGMAVPDQVVIVGGSSVGVLLARRLNMHSKSFVIIEKDNARYEQIREKGLNVIHGDGTHPNLYVDLKIRPSTPVVVYTGSDETNLAICEMLKHELQHDRIISKPGNSRMEQLMNRLNVDLLDSRRVLATTLENLIIRPSTYRTIIESFENYTVEEVMVTNPAFDGKQVREVPFHRDATLVLVKKGEEMHVPHGNTYLRTGDIITFFGTDSAIQEIEKLLK